jgi:hypothetical protein
MTDFKISNPTAARRGGVGKFTPGEPWRAGPFDPHYNAETVVVIPPSSEGVAFKPAT